MEQTSARINVPKDVSKMLLTDEHVLLSVRQSMWKAPFTPDTIVVTDQRVIRCSPSGFMGLHKDIEDYRFEDMANVKINKGILFATVVIGHRLMNESLVLDSLPNSSANSISKAVEENIRKARGGTATKMTPPDSSHTALSILKERFARGEITKAQFEEMKRTLE